MVKKCILLPPVLAGRFMVVHITVILSWVWWRLKSPASRLFTWTVCLGANQRKHQSSASLAFMRGIHRWVGEFTHKEPITRKMVQFDDVILICAIFVIMCLVVVVFFWGGVVLVFFGGGVAFRKNVYLSFNNIECGWNLIRNSLHKGQYLACLRMGIGKVFGTLQHCLTFHK